MTQVLLATDGGAPATAALEVLDAVVARNASIAVRSVVDAPLQLRADAEREAQHAIDVAAGVLTEAGFEVSAEFIEGHPGPEIVRAADAMDADLIVVGAGNHRWLERTLFGSVSTKILHTAATSVLVVHEPLPTVRPAKVLLGIDGSDGSATASDVLTRLLDPGRVEVTVATVATYAVPTLTGPGVGYASGGFTPAIEAEITAAAEATATQAASRLGEAGFQATPVWEMGPPASCLLERARSLEAALVVVGSRGLGSFDRAVLGSVSDQVARHAGATLVARPGD